MPIARTKPFLREQRSQLMASFIFLIYALGHLALFGWALALLLRRGHAATVPLLIVTFGLVYDNALLAAGSMMGLGDTLQQLSVPRYFMHAFGTPLLMLSALGLTIRSDVEWARTPVVMAAVAVLTLGMIAVGVEADLVSLELEAKNLSGVVSYGNAASAGPPLAPMVTIVILIAAGIIIWRRGGGIWLLLGSLVQFAAAAVGDAIVVAGNFGELALLAGLVVTDHKLPVARRGVATP